MRFKHIEGQLARWLEELSSFDMEIIHRPGKKHCNADGLSRIPDDVPECDCYRAGLDPTKLPCHGCKYCLRAHEQWSRFGNDVDDVIPLATKSVIASVRTVSVVAENDKDMSTDQEPTALAGDCHSDPSPNLDDTLPYADGNPCSNWAPEYPPEQLKIFQQEDPELAPILKWMEEDVEPTQAELRLQSRATRSLWLCRPCFVMFNHVLYYKFIGCPARQGLCLVVPSELKGEVLKNCHDTKTSGHLGQKKTLDKLKQAFLWYNMRKDCDDYVSTCATCSQNKKAHAQPRAPLGQFHAGYPMERVHLDILGPFNTSNSGNNYVLMMVDQFTKWVEMAALPEQTAKLIAEKFIVHFVVTFGCPLEIHTDQGRNFDSDLFKTLCDALEIAKTRTTPYHPSSNGQVERYNTIVLAMIRCFIEKNCRNWDRDLPFLSMAMHSMVNRQTGFTPNQMMLGRETIQPVHLLLGMPQYGQNRMTPNLWVKHLVGRMQKIHEFARHSLHTSQLRQKRDYDLRVVEHKYQPGDLVYKADSTTKVGQSRKLKSPWCGPFLVVSSRPPLYTIRGRKGDSVVHHDKLKLCNDRDIPTWIKRLRHALFQAESEMDESWDDLDDTIPYGVDFNVQGMFDANQPTFDSVVLPQSLGDPSYTHTALTQELEQGPQCDTVTALDATSNSIDEPQNLDLGEISSSDNGFNGDIVDAELSSTDDEKRPSASLSSEHTSRYGRPIRCPLRYQT